MCCSKSECSLAIIMQKTLQSIFIYLSVLLLNLVLRERRIMAQGTFIRRMNGESRNLRSHRIRGWNKICHSILWSYEKGENLIYSTKTGLFLKFVLLDMFLLQIQVGYCYSSVGFLYQLSDRSRCYKIWPFELYLSLSMLL